VGPTHLILLSSRMLGTCYLSLII